MQIYYYSLCLKHLLNDPIFIHEGSAAIWLPPSDDRAISLANLKAIDTSLLAPSMDYFLFTKLPGIVYSRREKMDWHYNPLCRPCPYNESCREVAVKEGKIGNIPNVSLEDAQALKTLLNITTPLRASRANIPDIEELYQLVSTPPGIKSISVKSPIIVKRVRRVLALPLKGQADISPVLEAVRTKQPQVRSCR